MAPRLLTIEGRKGENRGQASRKSPRNLREKISQATSLSSRSLLANPPRAAAIPGRRGSGDTLSQTPPVSLGSAPGQTGTACGRGDGLKRRDFITMLGGACAVAERSAREAVGYGVGRPAQQLSWMIDGSAPFGRASRMLAISKGAISQSSIARPMLASTACRHWPPIWCPTA